MFVHTPIYDTMHNSAKKFNISSIIAFFYFRRGVSKCKLKMSFLVLEIFLFGFGKVLGIF